MPVSVCGCVCVCVFVVRACACRGGDMSRPPYYWRTSTILTRSMTSTPLISPNRLLQDQLSVCFRSFYVHFDSGSSQCFVPSVSEVSALPRGALFEIEGIALVL